jgi:hypothetical protein
MRLGVTINSPVASKGRVVSRESHFSPMTTTILIMTPTFREIPAPVSNFLPFDIHRWINQIGSIIVSFAPPPLSKRHVIWNLGPGGDFSPNLMRSSSQATSDRQMDYDLSMTAGVFQNAVKVGFPWVRPTGWRFSGRSGLFLPECLRVGGE